MKSEMTRTFRSLYKALPLAIRKIAIENYGFWKNNSKHPSLHFKPISPKRLRVWSVRVGSDYRALALVENDTAKWFWIGTHKNYERILRGLKEAKKGKF